MSDKPDPDLLDRIADSFSHTAEYIEAAGAGELHRVMVGTGSGPVPPGAAAGMLKFQAVMMRKLAQQVREGKQVARHRCATDG